MSQHYTVAGPSVTISAGAGGSVSEALPKQGNGQIATIFLVQAVDFVGQGRAWFRLGDASVVARNSDSLMIEGQGQPYVFSTGNETHFAAISSATGTRVIVVTPLVE